jgi:hypothetical protein
VLIESEFKKETHLNSKQRIVLIMGAAAFMYVIFTSPKVSIVNGTYVIPPTNRKDIAQTMDVRTAMTREFAVLGATLLVSFAIKDKEEPRIQSTLGRNPLAGGCQESEREPVKKGGVSKIIRFLKEFF